jgi:hypothetical protein
MHLKKINKEKNLFNFILTLKSNKIVVLEKIAIYIEPINDDKPMEKKRRLMKSDCAERREAK